MYPNGVIQTYRVTVYRTDDSSDIIFYDSTVTDISVMPSVMVLPFTNYTVTVAASTSAGEGEGETFIVESPEAGIRVKNIISLYSIYSKHFMCLCRGGISFLCVA